AQISQSMREERVELKNYNNRHTIRSNADAEKHIQLRNPSPWIRDGRVFPRMMHTAQGGDLAVLLFDDAKICLERAQSEKDHDLSKNALHQSPTEDQLT